MIQVLLLKVQLLIVFAASTADTNGKKTDPPQRESIKPVNVFRSAECPGMGQVAFVQQGANLADFSLGESPVLYNPATVRLYPIFHFQPAPFSLPCGNALPFVF